MATVMNRQTDMLQMLSMLLTCVKNNNFLLPLCHFSLQSAAECDVTSWFDLPPVKIRDDRDSAAGSRRRRSRRAEVSWRTDGVSPPTAVAAACRLQRCSSCQSLEPNWATAPALPLR